MIAIGPSIQLLIIPLQNFIFVSLLKFAFDSCLPVNLSVYRLISKTELRLSSAHLLICEGGVYDLDIDMLTLRIAATYLCILPIMFR